MKMKKQLPRPRHWQHCTGIRRAQLPLWPVPAPIHWKCQNKPKFLLLWGQCVLKRPSEYWLYLQWTWTGISGTKSAKQSWTVPVSYPARWSSPSHCTMCTLSSTMPLYLLWPCIRYNKKKGWIQGYILGKITDLEFKNHKNVKNVFSTHSNKLGHIYVQ